VKVSCRRQIEYDDWSRNGSQDNRDGRKNEVPLLAEARRQDVDGSDEKTTKYQLFEFRYIKNVAGYSLLVRLATILVRIIETFRIFIRFLLSPVHNESTFCRGTLTRLEMT
jgi:hypothetical protein